MQSSFPRVSNGHVDTGRQLPDTVGQRCPNCGSLRYKQTVSTESCDGCGLHCDYWGGGANQVYETMMARNHAAEQAERNQRESAEWLDHILNN